MYASALPVGESALRRSRNAVSDRSRKRHDDELQRERESEPAPLMERRIHSCLPVRSTRERTIAPVTCVDVQKLVPGKLRDDARDSAPIGTAAMVREPISDCRRATRGTAANDGLASRTRAAPNADRCVPATTVSPRCALQPEQLEQPPEPERVREVAHLVGVERPTAGGEQLPERVSNT
jgi:hypothetical protein